MLTTPLKHRAIAQATFLVLACALVGALLLQMDASPVLLRPALTEHPGTLVSPAGSDIVLVLPASQLPPPHISSPSLLPGQADLAPLEPKNAITGWINLLEQTFGPVQTASLERTSARLGTHGKVSAAAGLPPSPAPDSPPPRVLVFPIPPEPPPPGLVSSLLDHVRRGGAVILERPSSTWFPLTGVNLGLPPVYVQHITGTRLMLPAPALKLLFGLRLPLYRFPVTHDDSLKVLLEIDHTPGLLVRQVGEGVVMTTTFPLAPLLQALQQGLPGPGGQLTNRRSPPQSLPLETNDLVLDSPLLQAEWPVADLLEDAIAQQLAQSVGLPGIWAYPGSHPGALLLSHDEEAMGDKALWMAEADEEQGCTSTYFVVPSPAISPQALRRLTGLSVETALHTILPGPENELYPGSGLGTEGRFEPLGIWRLTPIWRLFNVQEQRTWLQALANDLPPIVSSRTHFLAWPKEHAAYFSELAAGGIRIDSSYGPDIQNRGFLFGTARPFRPAGADGLPLPLFELPFVSAEDLGGADRQFLHGLMQQSATTTFQALSVLYHPNAYRWHPSAPNYRTWRSLCPRAQQLNLWTTTFSALEQFTRARAQASLHSTFSETADQRRLEIGFQQLPLNASLSLPVQQGRWTLQAVLSHANNVGPDSHAPLSAVSPLPLVFIQVAGQPVALVSSPLRSGKLTAVYRRSGT